MRETDAQVEGQTPGDAPVVLDKSFQGFGCLVADNSLAFGIGFYVAEVGVGEAIQRICLKERVVGAGEAVGALRVSAASLDFLVPLPIDPRLEIMRADRLADAVGYGGQTAC